MKTIRTAAARRVGLAVVLLAGSAVAAPAMAACNPTARAQSEAQTLPDLTGGVPTTVHLDGTGSTPKSGGLSYAWTYLGSTPTGYAVTLVNRTTATPTFAAPDVGVAGANLSFRLTVTCEGNTSTATTSINITDVVSNFPPTAVGAVSPANIHEGDLVTLDGTASYDLNNTPQTSGLTYQWTQVDGTGNPVAGGVTLTPNASGSIATFVAPNMANSTLGSTLRFRLTVSDGTLTNSTDKLVTVLWLNDPPVARLVCPTGVIDVDEGDLVTLDGSGSSDTDDGIRSYQWSQENGPPNIAVASLTTSVIHFTAPSLGYQQIGSLPFTLTVTDNTGDSSQAACSVFIHDITPPVINVPGDMSVEASSAQGATQSYSVTAFDAVDDLVPYPLACTPPSGSLFPLGATTVQCATADSAQNQATASFKITVADTTAPVMQGHADVGVEATSAAGAIVPFDLPVATDAVDAAPIVTCAPPSGSQFALGSTQVTCNVVDHTGNAGASTSFNVDVIDTTAPVVTPPADVTAEATGPQTTVTHGVATATDAVGVVSQNDDAPATFPVGVTTIHWTATDAAGNTGSATSLVTVTDTTPPVIASHADVGPIEATSAAGATVSYTLPGTSDLVDGTGSASCSPLSGTQFALGVTNVACAAIDHAGNHAVTTYFKVTVRDSIAPVIGPHGDISAEATGPSGAVVFYTSPATSDAVDGTGTASCLAASGSTFAIGVNTVTCSAQDAAGNASTPTTFHVTVVDTTAPVIAAHADVNVSATGNSSALVTYALPTAIDLVDGAVQVTCMPASGSSFNVGSTTVNCGATDHAGNHATSSFQVIVSYAFNGFYRPVDNLPTLNVVKAGSAVPVKFSLGGDQGLNIFASGYPASVSTACNAATTDAIEETVTAGGSSLSFDATTGQYIYVWKTEKSWAGGCRQLQVKLRDGSSRWAAFNFSR